jgi:hypothetical protein
MYVCASFDSVLCGGLMQLSERSSQEGVHRIHADPQMIGNLPVLHRFQSEQQNLLFSPREKAQETMNSGRISGILRPNLSDFQIV